MLRLKINKAMPFSVCCRAFLHRNTTIYLFNFLRKLCAMQPKPNFSGKNFKNESLFLCFIIVFPSVGWNRHYAQRLENLYKKNGHHFYLFKDNANILFLTFGNQTFKNRSWISFFKFCVLHVKVFYVQKFTLLIFSPQSLVSSGYWSHGKMPYNVWQTGEVCDAGELRCIGEDNDYSWADFVGDEKIANLACLRLCRRALIPSLSSKTSLISL